MSPEELRAIGAGFSNESQASQRVFRASLQALSHPGRVVLLEHDADTPQAGNAASAGLLLALLDADCTVWLSPTLACSNAAPWLRFHTGCRLVEQPGQAQFAWIADINEMPPLAQFAAGSDAYPEQSTTCVLDVPHFTQDASSNTDSAAWRLSGPGIQSSIVLRPGLNQAQGADLAAQWADNHASFPCGIDLLLAAPDQIVGLTRTSRIEFVAKD